MYNIAEAGVEIKQTAFKRRRRFALYLTGFDQFQLTGTIVDNSVSGSTKPRINPEHPHGSLFQVGIVDVKISPYFQDVF